MYDKWKRLTVKSEQFKINDELAIPVKGLSFKEMGHLAGFQDKRDFEGAMDYILFVTMRKGIPRDGPEAMTDDQIREIMESLSGDVGFSLVQKVQELTGLAGKDVKN